jgi:hypothetical protein
MTWHLVKLAFRFEIGHIPLVVQIVHVFLTYLLISLLLLWYCFLSHDLLLFLLFVPLFLLVDISQIIHYVYWSACFLNFSPDACIALR